MSEAFQETGKCNNKKVFIVILDFIGVGSIEIDSIWSKRDDAKKRVIEMIEDKKTCWKLSHSKGDQLTWINGENMISVEAHKVRQLEGLDI